MYKKFLCFCNYLVYHYLGNIVEVLKEGILMKRFLFALCSFMQFFVLISNPVSSGTGFSIIAPTTITQSGTYRLAFDIAGPLIIDADYVTLDLNNHSISGTTQAVSITNHHTITICNGTLRATTDQALAIDNSHTISIKNIVFDNNANSILLLNSSDIAMDTITTFSSSGRSLVVNACTNCLCQNASFLNGSFVGEGDFAVVQVVNSSSNIQFIDCLIGNNSSISPGSNLFCINIDNSNDVLCKNINIIANQAGKGLVGIRDFTANKTIVHSCRINNNFSFGADGEGSFTGILFESDNSSIADSCIIEQNSTTGGAGDVFGITILFSNFCSIQNNRIISNSAFGGISIGINHPMGTFNHIILKNYVNDLTTGYSIVGGVIPIATLSFAAGTLTSNIMDEPVSCFFNIETAA